MDTPLVAVARRDRGRPSRLIDDEHGVRLREDDEGRRRRLRGAADERCWRLTHDHDVTNPQLTVASAGLTVDAYLTAGNKLA